MNVPKITFVVAFSSLLFIPSVSFSSTVEYQKVQVCSGRYILGIKVMSTGCTYKWVPSSQVKEQNSQTNGDRSRSNRRTNKENCEKKGFKLNGLGRCVAR